MDKGITKGAYQCFTLNIIPRPVPVGRKPWMICPCMSALETNTGRTIMNGKFFELPSEKQGQIMRPQEIQEQSKETKDFCREAVYGEGEV